jgi:RNA polymerase sigma-70 factor (ECF subfamily)
MDEEEAIAQLKNGNIAALQTLVEMYQVQAVQIAALITQDRAMAEDIVQSAFIRCFERIKQFDSSRPFRPWFLRIVTNDALKAVMKQKRQVPLEGRNDEAYQQLVAYLDATITEPEDIVQRNEIREAVQKAFTGLSPQQKEAILLRYYLGFNEQEISAQMSITPGSVKRHLYAARERLRSLLLPLSK